MTDEECMRLKLELRELETRQDQWTQEERKRYHQIARLLRPPLEDVCKELTERQFMLLVEFDNSWTIEEKLAFYHKHCKKN